MNPTTLLYNEADRVSLAVPPVSDSNMSGQINEIATALSKAQGALTAATKDQAGYGYNYSDLNSVINTAKTTLEANGLSVIQLVGPTTDVVSVTTILSHSSGQYFKSVATLPVIEMKGCNPAQAAGASLSYLRRYAYQAILGMASEDHDASSNGPKVNTPAPKKAKAPVKTTPKTVEPAADTTEAGSFRRKKRNTNVEL